MLPTKFLFHMHCKHKHSIKSSTAAIVAWCCCLIHVAHVACEDPSSANANQNSSTDHSISAEYFLENVFEKYNSSSVITINQLQSILSSLRIGSINGCNGTCSSDSEKEGEEKSEKEAALSKLVSEEGESENKTCYSAANILDMYGITGDSITAENFSHICPALIQQQLSSSCVAAETSKKEHFVWHVPTHAESYGYGTLSVFIISYLPMTILLSIPSTDHKAFPYVMSALIALGASTLLSDGTLHLIPEALMSEDEEESDSNDPSFDPTILKIVLLLAAIYAMYLLEMMIGTRPRVAKGEGISENSGHGHSHALPVKKTESHQMQEMPSKAQLKDNDQNSCSSCSLDVPTVAVVESNASKPEKEKSESISTQEYFKIWGREMIPNKTFGWMIIVGDTVHNFMDGIAIGATMSTRLVQGFATSLAIFFHEIPHEVGDVAALMRAGCTWRGAITWHLLQSIAAFAGLYVGLGVSTDESSRQFVFALTAGIFLQVSLTSLLPELHQIPDNFWVYFLVQNIGIQVGFWIMFVIAIYEGPMGHMFG